MRFWDSSALVPVLVEQPPSLRMAELYRDEKEIVVWRATRVECVSALSRLERMATVSQHEVKKGFARLEAMWPTWIPVEPNNELWERACTMLRDHPLRAADALQLAAAFEAAEHQPETLALVTLDKRLHTAAKAEGFQLPEMPDAS